MMQLTITSFKSDTTRFSADHVFSADQNNFFNLWAVRRRRAAIKQTARSFKTAKSINQQSNQINKYFLLIIAMASTTIVSSIVFNKVL